MEVIELLSEPSESNLPARSNKRTREVIMYVLKKYVVQGNMLTTSLSDYSIDDDVPENPKTHEEWERKNEGQVTDVHIPMTSSQPPTAIANAQMPSRNKSILDLNNWISSSDDDSFTRDLLKDLSPKRPKINNLRNMLKSVLNSSPIIERVSQPLESIPESLSPIRSLPKSTALFPRPNPPRTPLFTRSDISDPISSSSIVSSPVKLSLENDRNKNANADKTKRAASVKEKDTGEFTTKEWRDANRATRKKEEILDEMIIEIALNLKDTLETDYFKEIFVIPKVRNTYLELPMVSWKRRIKATYDGERDVFVPCKPTEVSERIILLYYQAEELISKIKEGSLEEAIKRTRARANMEDPSVDYHLLIMVLGYREYLRKLQSAEHRRYKEQMLERMQEKLTKKRTDLEHTISAAEAQKLVMETEVDMSTNMFFPKSKEEAVDWLHSFTFTIGTSLYDKYERNPQFANFGSVRLGTDQKSTFMEMTKRFSLMTHQKAERLYEYYTSVGALCKRLSSHDDLGKVNGKGIVPPSVNSAMKKLFRATDPDEVIVD